MKYNQPIGAAEGAAYVDANPGLGIDGSPVPAAAIEHPMREIENVIVAGGIIPSSGNLAQLLTALRSEGVFQTANQFDKSTKTATTEFVQRALGNLQTNIGFAVSGTISPSAVGSWIAPVASGVTFTLPLVSSVPPGSVLIFDGNNLGCTIIRQGLDTISVGPSLLTTMSLLPNDTIFLVSSSTSWFAFGGEARLAKSSAFSSVLAGNGYQKLPSGRIEVQGTFTASATPGAAVSVTFPLGATNVRNLQLTPVSTGTASITTWFDTPTGSGFNGHCSVASAVVHYRAILD